MDESPELEVEPLPERRWDEIRRTVLARAVEARRTASPLPGASPRGWQLATGVALVAAGVLAWIALRPVSPAGVPMGRVVTESAAATASAGDVAVEVAPFSSVMILARAQDEWLVGIEHGSARFLVPPRSGRAPFRVEAGETSVTVVGTVFTVSRVAGAARGSVAVEHGTVRVVERGQEAVLREGDSWPRASLLEARQPAPATAAARGAAVSSRPDVAPEPGESAPRRPRRGVATADTRVDGEDPLVVESPHPPGATSEPTPSPDDPSPPTVGDERALYMQAAGIEATEPARALEIYEALAERGGRWGATALFAQARLELEQDHDARARALLERYLRENPNGVNAEDARHLLEQL